MVAMKAVKIPISPFNDVQGEKMRIYGQQKKGKFSNQYPLLKN